MNEDEKLKRKLIEKHLSFNANDFFHASVQSYAKDGKASGSFFMALKAMMDEYKSLTTPEAKECESYYANNLSLQKECLNCGKLSTEHTTPEAKECELTPEWLTLVGFECTVMQGFYLWEQGDFSIYEVDGEFGIRFPSFKKNIELKTISQIQKLYHSIMGNYLTPLKK